MIANFIFKASQIMQDSNNITFLLWHCRTVLRKYNICAYDYANEHSYMIVLYGHLSFCMKSIKVMSADRILGCHFDEFINSCYVHVWWVPENGGWWHHIEICCWDKVRPVHQESPYLKAIKHHNGGQLIPSPLFQIITLLHSSKLSLTCIYYSYLKDELYSHSSTLYPELTWKLSKSNFNFPVMAWEV